MRGECLKLWIIEKMVELSEQVNPDADDESIVLREVPADEEYGPEVVVDPYDGLEYKLYEGNFPGASKKI